MITHQRVSILAAMPIMGSVQATMGTVGTALSALSVMMTADLVSKISLPSPASLVSLKLDASALIGILPTLPGLIGKAFPPTLTLSMNAGFAAIPGAVSAIRSILSSLSDLLTAFGVCVYIYEGSTADMGGELVQTIRWGTSDGSTPRSDCLAIALVATDETSKTVLQSVFRV